ncbi:6480_t:CDS:2 [Diversispora eburnea]|uniref:6480_t:CDS:1 n=1 Tax=Diversispora eburnea TaxID=1213867 RepID=A0A9N8YQ39_9GLOM|nr:6480_t:CDS:2 [Diversispora eburnea]
MYSGNVPPSHHQPTGGPIRTEYHSPGRAEYPPEGYYTPPIPPPHHLVYDYHLHHPPHHYIPYPIAPMNPSPMPQVLLPDEYSDQVSSKRTTSKSDSINANSTSQEVVEKNIASSSVKNSTQNLNTKTKFKKERFGTFDTQAVSEDEKRSYSLIVCQQPLRARMCGFGEKDRRPIDPPPIVQLVVNDDKGKLDTREERNVISNPPKTTRVLMGSLVSSPAILKNTTGEPGCYFCFPDLSIRTEGKYTLKFSLMKLGTEDRLINTKTEIIATTFSDPFTVYSAKKFPGMTESTELSKAFAKQGLKIPIRNDVRPRKVLED